MNEETPRPEEGLDRAPQVEGAQEVVDYGQEFKDIQERYDARLSQIEEIEKEAFGRTLIHVDDRHGTRDSTQAVINRGDMYGKDDPSARREGELAKAIVAKKAEIAADRDRELEALRERRQSSRMEKLGDI